MGKEKKNKRASSGHSQKRTKPKSRNLGAATTVDLQPTEHFAQTVKTKGRDKPFYFRKKFPVSKFRSVKEISQFVFHSFKGLLLIYPND